MEKFYHSTNSFNDALRQTYADQELKKLLFGFLKHSNIFPNHPHFDDLEQECRLTLAHALLAAGDEIQRGRLKEERLNVFLYQKLRWRLADYFRHHGRHDQHSDYSLDAPVNAEEPGLMPTALVEAPDWDRRHHLAAVFQQVKADCPARQRAFLVALEAHPDWSNNQLAAKLGVTPQTASYFRQQLKKRIQKELNEES